MERALVAPERINIAIATVMSIITMTIWDTARRVETTLIKIAAILVSSTSFSRFLFKIYILIAQKVTLQK
jgi:hypothetical protein